MTCETSGSLLEAYLDEELDAAQAAQVAEHLAGCPACAGSYARLLELRAGIRSHAPYYRAPAGLRERIRSAARESSRQATAPWRAMAIAAGILLAVSAGWNAALWRSRAGSADSIARSMAQTIESSHVRSLIGTHLLDVPSTDQHTVKPWFNGKLDFSPDVRDFAEQGFPLIGGRIDYVGDRTVAALVYRRRQHIVNVFTWPSDARGGETESDRNGYHLIHWNAGGMAWWAVSDLNLAELRRFEHLYRAAGDAAP